MRRRIGIDVGGTYTDAVLLEVDQIFQDLSRDEALGRARQLAEDKAVAAGADRATLTVVEMEDLPLTYLPGNSLRTRVRVVETSRGERRPVP